MELLPNERKCSDPLRSEGIRNLLGFSPVPGSNRGELELQGYAPCRLLGTGNNMQARITRASDHRMFEPTCFHSALFPRESLDKAFPSL